jgi:hypothetical protein
MMSEAIGAVTRISPDILKNTGDMMKVSCTGGLARTFTYQQTR